MLILVWFVVQPNLFRTDMTFPLLSSAYPQRYCIHETYEHFWIHSKRVRFSDFVFWLSIFNDLRQFLANLEMIWRRIQNQFPCEVYRISHQMTHAHSHNRFMKNVCRYAAAGFFLLLLFHNHSFHKSRRKIITKIWKMDEWNMFSLFRWSFFKLLNSD